MLIDFLLDTFRDNSTTEAMIWKDEVYYYNQLLSSIKKCINLLEDQSIEKSTSLILEADYSPNTIAMFLSAIDRACIIAPITPSSAENKEEFIDIAQGEHKVIINSEDQITFESLDNSANHEFYIKLREENHPGLVLFSSGTTGQSKAAIHDLTRLLEKYKKKRLNYKTIAFMLFDHIGGIDTLFYTLSNGSCMIILEDRTPEYVCHQVEKHRAEVLPVSPSFLNLMLLDRTYHKYDLSSLRYITYGAEVMLESTLKKCAEIFPNVTIMQKYGTTEVGTLRSKSKSSDSLFVKIGGDGYQTRIVDGMLQIKAKSSMLGYLNAPSPFTEDGWFFTGDMVESEGEFIKILGRNSDIINVGGEKVYPAEVENIIIQLDKVKDVTVFGEKNPLLGNIVCAKINIDPVDNEKEFIKMVKSYCQEKLKNYKVPVKIEISYQQHFSLRFKKKRM